ncbi:MAG TPA: WS/DGAT domain-containing protein, partial [Nocardioidaceae bacterium]|nr:WS/DGAT domain-containing protein [Nocardioidaceae bacterium]
AAPLWAARFVTGLSDGRTALVVVLHHVLSDGIGGLAVLANLVDPGPVVEPRSFPRQPPTAKSLAVEAWEGRLAAARRIVRWSRLLRRSMAAGGGLHPPRAGDCSLIQRTGSRRQLAVVRAEHARLRAAAHRYGATTNDALLVAVAGALNRVLLERGESADRLVVTVPVAGRRAASGPDLGNVVTPIIVAVPTTGAVPERLADVAAQVRAAKRTASVPPPIALLGWLFRPLAALGGYHWYMNHQHRFHTLVSHLRGPAEQLAFAGAAVESAVPVVVAEGGNATAYFGVLSYAGTLSISAIVDPDHFPDLATLTAGLRAELEVIAGAGPT